jgi:hypothetical protein
MTSIAHQFRTSYITTATATALLFNFPHFAEIHAASLAPTHFYDEFEPLADISKSVSDALASRNYSNAESEAVFPLLAEVAIRLVETSKPLDRDFSKVVQKEFWTLLQ